MNEIEEDLKNKIGKTLLIFLDNNFRFEGVLLNVYNNFLKINDKKSGERFINLEEIKTFEVMNNG